MLKDLELIILDSKLDVGLQYNRATKQASALTFCERGNDICPCTALVWLYQRDWVKCLVF